MELKSIKCTRFKWIKLRRFPKLPKNHKCDVSGNANNLQHVRRNETFSGEFTKYYHFEKTLFFSIATLVLTDSHLILCFIGFLSYIFTLIPCIN